MLSVTNWANIDMQSHAIRANTSINTLQKRKVDTQLYLHWKHINIIKQTQNNYYKIIIDLCIDKI